MVFKVSGFRILSVLALMFLFFVPHMAKAEMNSDREAYRLELNSLFQTMDTYYGPLELKKTTIGLNWPAKKQSYTAKIDQLKSSNDFYFLVSDVLNSLNDAHVAMELPSTLMWTLPMQFSNVENSVIVSFYNSTAMLTEKCPVALGDELTNVNGRTLDEVQATQPVFAKYGNPITNRAMFARMLTSLNEARGVRLAQFGGPKVNFTFKKATTGTAYTCALTYKAQGNGLIDRGMGEPMTRPASLLSLTPERFEFDQQLDELIARDAAPCHPHAACNV